MPVTELSETPGSLASAYKATLRSLDGLLQQLNQLQEQGKLPEDFKLDQRIQAGIVATQLGKLHFITGWEIPND